MRKGKGKREKGKGKRQPYSNDLVNTTQYLDVANRRLDRALAGFDVPQKLADALASILKSHGGEIRTETEVRSVSALPPARAYLFDVRRDREALGRQLVRRHGASLPTAARGAQ